MSKKVIHYMPYTQRTAATDNHHTDRTDRMTKSSVPSHLYGQQSNTLPNHLAMRESFKYKNAEPNKAEIEIQQVEEAKAQRIQQLQSQNKKLERMWLYLRDCNITGLGFNKQYYQKKKESIIGKQSTNVSSLICAIFDF